MRWGHELADYQSRNESDSCWAPISGEIGMAAKTRPPISYHMSIPQIIWLFNEGLKNLSITVRVVY